MDPSHEIRSRVKSEILQFVACWHHHILDNVKDGREGAAAQEKIVRKLFDVTDQYSVIFLQSD